MDRRPLGSSALAITPVGVGAWAIGGTGWRLGWGPQDDAESIATIERAVELGVNWIDTAAVYGLGHSEEVIGRALAGLAPAERPLVFTKCSRVWDEEGATRGELAPASLRRETEASLRRLGVEALDLQQVHRPEPEEQLEEGWAALAALKAEGLVRAIGVSNFSVEQMERVRAVAPIDCAQVEYSLLARGVEADVLRYCERHGIGVIVWSPQAHGLLSGAMTRERVAAFPEDDFRRAYDLFAEPRLSHGLAVAGRLGEVGARHGASAGAAAVAWTLRHPAVTGAIVGVRRPEQAEPLPAAASLCLSDAEAAELEALG